MILPSASVDGPGYEEPTYDDADDHGGAAAPVAAAAAAAYVVPGGLIDAFQYGASSDAPDASLRRSNLPANERGNSSTSSTRVGSL